MLFCFAREKIGTEDEHDAHMKLRLEFQEHLDAPSGISESSTAADSFTTGSIDNEDEDDKDLEPGVNSPQPLSPMRRYATRIASKSSVATSSVDILELLDEAPVERKTRRASFGEVEYCTFEFDCTTFESERPVDEALEIDLKEILAYEVDGVQSSEDEESDEEVLQRVEIMREGQELKRRARGVTASPCHSPSLQFAVPTLTQSRLWLRRKGSKESSG